MYRLEQKLLDTCHIRGHFKNASDTHTDQRIEFDKLDGKRRLKRKTIKALGTIINKEYPELTHIVTVGNGANWMAEPLAKRVSKLKGQPVGYFITKKLKDGDNRFYIETGNVRIKNNLCVIVDDVYNFGTNTGKVRTLIEKFGGIALGVATVFNRNPNGETLLRQANQEDIQVNSMVSVPIDSWPAENCDPITCEIAEI